MHMPLVLTNRRRRGGSASAPAFSPTSLYSSGAQGIWLDPSDLSTMFSDRAGTTPVTTPGTVVGLRLDKSKGLALGSELVTLSALGATADWSFSSGIWTLASSTSNSQTLSFGGMTSGLTYKITVTVASLNAGSLTFRHPNSSTTVPGAPVITAAGTYTFYLQTTSTIFYLRNSTTGQTATVSGFSVRELAGNHAVAPTDAARPIYGVEPKGGRRNLLTYSEAFNESVWLKTAVTVPTTQYTAPDGTLTADKMVESATTRDHFFTRAGETVSTATSYTLSCYAKAAERTVFAVYVGGVTGTGVTSFNLSTGAVIATSNNTVASITETPAGSGWYRCSVTVTTNSTSLVPYFYPNTGGTAYAGDGTSGILLWGAQLELGSTATNYQRATTAYDITESGVATCHYVQYDGSDDSMSTAAIDFTGTDKMSVFAGVRKLSDAAAGMLLELSVNYNTNAGAFYITAPENAGAAGNYAVAARGAAGVNVSQTAKSAVILAPISSILTATNDIAGDLSAIRVNGAASGTDGTGEKGTGNFRNDSLYIGRRGNATLPFSGKDYGIIVVGKAATTTEITDTETWLAARTAQVTL